MTIDYLLTLTNKMGNDGLQGEVPISKERSKDETETGEKRKKKENVREYDPEKDGLRVIIGGYSSYVKKKKVIA